jgi:hypothetical protein
LHTSITELDHKASAIVAALSIHHAELAPKEQDTKDRRSQTDAKMMPSRMLF